MTRTGSFLCILSLVLCLSLAGCASAPTADPPSETETSAEIIEESVSESNSAIPQEGELPDDIRQRFLTTLQTQKGIDLPAALWMEDYDGDGSCEALALLGDYDPRNDAYIDAQLVYIPSDCSSVDDYSSLLQVITPNKRWNQRGYIGGYTNHNLVHIQDSYFLIWEAFDNVAVPRSTLIGVVDHQPVLMNISGQTSNLQPGQNVDLIGEQDGKLVGFYLEENQFVPATDPKLTETEVLKQRDLDVFEEDLFRHLGYPYEDVMRHVSMDWEHDIWGSDTSSGAILYDEYAPQIVLQGWASSRYSILGVNYGTSPEKASELMKANKYYLKNTETNGIRKTYTWSDSSSWNGKDTDELTGHVVTYTTFVENGVESNVEEVSVQYFYSVYDQIRDMLGPNVRIRKSKK